MCCFTSLGAKHCSISSNVRLERTEANWKKNSGKGEIPQNHPYQIEKSDSVWLSLFIGSNDMCNTTDALCLSSILFSTRCYETNDPKGPESITTLQRSHLTWVNHGLTAISFVYLGGTYYNQQAAELGEWFSVIQRGLLLQPSSKIAGLLLYFASRLKLRELKEVHRLSSLKHFFIKRADNNMYQKMCEFFITDITDQPPITTYALPIMADGKLLTTDGYISNTHRSPTCPILHRFTSDEIRSNLAFLATKRFLSPI